MINIKNTADPMQIRISNLELKDLETYLAVEFDAFYEKLKFIYSSRREAAYNIIRNEISNNIGSKRYFTANLNGEILGIIELVSQEVLSGYKRSFLTYLKNLGFFKAIKAYFLNKADMPVIDEDTMYIDNVAVAAGKRRKGVGRKMLAFARDYAKSMGKDTLKLWVAMENTPAYNLYRNFGFSKITTRSSWIAERYFGYREWVFMEKIV